MSGLNPSPEINRRLATGGLVVKDSYRIDEIALLLGARYSTIYTMLKRGDLEGVKVGGATRVTLASVARVFGDGDP